MVYILAKSENTGKTLQFTQNKLLSYIIVRDTVICKSMNMDHRKYVQNFLIIPLLHISIQINYARLITQKHREYSD